MPSSACRLFGVAVSAAVIIERLLVLVATWLPGGLLKAIICALSSLRASITS